MSGTALFTFFFFFFFVHSAASPAGITMSSCLLLCFTALPLQLASQCSAVTRPTGTRSKRVGNNPKLVCASGRQSVIVANHTSIASLDGLPRFPSCLWGRRDPWMYYHELQGGGHHHHHLHSHVPHQQGMGERIVYPPNPEARKTVLGKGGGLGVRGLDLLVFLIVLVLSVSNSSRFT
jgi:hypothetical protein